jgi:HEAT repeat protein
VRPAKWIFIVLAIACTTAPALAAEADVGKLIMEFTGDAEPVERSQADLEAAHLNVLDHLLPTMGSERAADRSQPCQTYETIVLRAARPDAEAERIAVSKAMAARLGPKTPLPARKWMLRLAVNVARDEMVPVLTSLLEDKDAIVRERARRALQHNPSPKAADALRAALAKAKDTQWRVALINALAWRSDEATVQALIQQAQSDEASVRTAAVEALGRIGDKAAAKVIAAATGKGSKDARQVATDNYLLLADKLCAQGDHAAALSMYRQLLDRQGHIKCAAVIGMGRAGGVQALDTIFEALKDKDRKVRGAALGALELLPTVKVIGPLQQRLQAAAPELKVLLLRALAKRADTASLPAFVQAAKDSDAAVRTEAYAGMARIGDPAAAPVLVAALMKADGDELAAAKRALASIPGTEVGAALVAALATAKDADAAAIIDVLVNRRASQVVPDLLNVARQRKGKVRAKALGAVSELGTPSALSDLLELLLAAESEEARSPVEHAAIKVCRRAQEPEPCAGPVIAACEGASVPAKASLMRILGRLRGQKALARVRAAAKSDQEPVQDAAVRALATWDDPVVADDLIAIAKNSPSQVHRVLALRGFVKVVSLVRDRSPDQMLELYEQAMAAARRPEDKKRVLSGLANVSNLAALRMVERYRTDPALQGEAVAATVRIARAILGSHPQEAKDALEQVPRLTKDKALINDAKQAIQMIERLDDYIVAWDLSGPYTNPKGKSMLDYAWPPEKEDAEDVDWQPMKIGTTPEKPWLMELDKVLGGGDRVAYLRTRVYSPKAQKVRMELGSDDQVKLWLNGKQVHKNAQMRACKPCQDKKVLQLKDGWNDVLMKVTQGHGEWAACLRFRTPQGGELEGLRADPRGR